MGECAYVFTNEMQWIMNIILDLKGSVLVLFSLCTLDYYNI